MVAEATLAGANLIYVVLLGLGGVVFPLTKFPRGARPLLELLPTGALSTGLRHVLANGEISRAVNVRGVKMSDGAKAKIVAAGGSVE